jgi:AcrR family transcriptional regulator
MIELVAERGYDAVTVRELARGAGVSTRSFYEHFSGKEECFLRAHEFVVRRTAKRIVAAQVGEADPVERLCLAFEAFATELECEPSAVRLALVEAYLGPPSALEQARRAECTFAAMIAESFAREPGGVRLSPLPAKAIVSGVASTARSHLLAGRPCDSRRLAAELAEWALSFRDPSVVDSCERASSTRPVRRHGSQPDVGGDGWPSRLNGGDRDAILSAATRLIGAEGPGDLTEQRVRAAAGVSRRAFLAQFDGLDACLAEIAAESAGEVLEEMARARAGADRWVVGVCRAIDVLCISVTSDPIFERLCFGAGAIKAERREWLVGELAALIFEPCPNAQSQNEKARLASRLISLRAVCALLDLNVADGQAPQVKRIAPILPYIVLVPELGAGQALADLPTHVVNR